MFMSQNHVERPNGPEQSTHLIQTSGCFVFIIPHKPGIEQLASLLKGEIEPGQGLGGLFYGGE